MNLFEIVSVEYFEDHGMRTKQFNSARRDGEV